MRRTFVFAVALAFVAAACGELPSELADAGAAGAPVVAAVGDIACKSLPGDPPRCKYDKVAELIRSIAPDRFLGLGDLQYLHGSAEQFAAFYDPVFADLKSITAPVPGNHELYTLYGEGYYDYFGKAAHGPGGFYSFDLGSWHLIGLNSQICKGSTWNPDLGQNTAITRNPAIGEGCGPGTAMYEWLKKDLVLNEDRPARSPSCTIRCSAPSRGRTECSCTSSSRSGSSSTRTASTSRSPGTSTTTSDSSRWTRSAGSPRTA